MTLESPSKANHWVESLSVQHFRGFSSLRLDGLGRINLVTGYNNVGKTALLEALFLSSGQLSINSVLTLNQLRGIAVFGPVTIASQQAPWRYLFHNFDASAPVRLWVSTYGDEHIQVSLRAISDVSEVADERWSVLRQILAPGSNVPYQQPLSVETLRPNILEMYASTPSGEAVNYTVLDQSGFRSTAFPNASFRSAIFRTPGEQFNPQEFAQEFGTIDLRDQLTSFVKGLQLIEPRLMDVRMIVTPAGPFLHGDIGIGEPVPIRLMGEGTNKLASLLVDAAAVGPGLLLIDELENGFHYSVLERLWGALDEATRVSGAQIIATTHSLECIRAAHSYFSGKLPLGGSVDFRLFRLDRVPTETEPDIIEAVCIDFDSIGHLLEMGLEVR